MYRREAGAVLGARGEVRDLGCACFVQLFGVSLGIWFERPATIHVLAETCGRALALEDNGGVFDRDYFVEPGLDVLCEGDQSFVRHLNGPMRAMARPLFEQRSPAGIMEMLAGAEGEA